MQISASIQPRTKFLQFGLPALTAPLVEETAMPTDAEARLILELARRRDVAEVVYPKLGC